MHRANLSFQASIADWTANRWGTMFADVAEKLLGRTSQEIGEIYEQNKEEGDAVLSASHFKRCLFKLRTKNEVYGDQTRNKITVQTISPLNYKEYNQYLVKQLIQLTGVGKN